MLAAYFKEQFGTSSNNYNSNVKTVFDDQTTNANNGGTFLWTDWFYNRYIKKILDGRYLGGYKNTSGDGVPI